MATQLDDLSFTDAAVRSGLVTRAKIDRVIERLGNDDPASIAATLVRSGVITQYQSDQLASGRTKLNLGPYLITDWIGQGGMGQVFKAVHRVMGRVCAVKVLPLEKSTAMSRDSFMREIRLQAELDHPCVVRAFDAGRDGSVHYLVTEFVPGTDLRHLVRNDGPLDRSRAAAIIVQVARGLHYAHDIGLVHRDIKPGNILVTPDGIAKLSDIGLATWTMGLDDDPRAGKIVGTADYLSPEQIQTPRSVGHRSDIYSLGCATYFAVTGKVPFPGGDARSKCRRHCEQTPWHPRKFAPSLSEAFIDVIADMMEKDPDRRIQTAAEVAERLEPHAGQIDELVGPISRDPWSAPPPPHESVRAMANDPGRSFGAGAAVGEIGPVKGLGPGEEMEAAGEIGEISDWGAMELDDPGGGVQFPATAGLDPHEVGTAATQSDQFTVGKIDSAHGRPFGRRRWSKRMEAVVWNAIVLAIGFAAGLLTAAVALP